MDKIRIKLDREPVELNGDLLLKAYNDSKYEIQKGDCENMLTMGIVNINGKDRFVSITIADSLE